MNNNELKSLVQRAINELSPKGIENAWEHSDGTTIKWKDILASLESTTVFIHNPTNPVINPVIDSDGLRIVYTGMELI